MQSSKLSKKSLKKDEEKPSETAPVSEAPKTRSPRSSKPAKDKVEATSGKIHRKSPALSSGRIEPNEPVRAKVMAAGAGIGTINGGIVDSVGVMAAAPVTEAPLTAVAGHPMPAISQEEIANLAYSYWEARGFSHGLADEDWIRAEAELLARG